MVFYCPKLNQSTEQLFRIFSISSSHRKYAGVEGPKFLETNAMIRSTSVFQHTGSSILIVTASKWRFISLHVCPSLSLSESDPRAIFCVYVAFKQNLRTDLTLGLKTMVKHNVLPAEWHIPVISALRSQRTRC